MDKKEPGKKKMSVWKKVLWAFVGLFVFSIVVGLLADDGEQGQVQNPKEVVVQGEQQRQPSDPQKEETKKETTKPIKQEEPKKPEPKKEETKKDGTKKNTNQKPVIPEDAISLMVNDMLQNTLVVDAAVSSNDNELSIVVIVNNATNKDAAKTIGDNAARRLGSAASIFNEDLQGPTKDYYGDIYKHYNLTVGVYHSYNTDKAVIKGYKARSSNTIKWR